LYNKKLKGNVKINMYLLGKWVKKRVRRICRKLKGLGLRWWGAIIWSIILRTSSLGLVLLIYYLMGCLLSISSMNPSTMSIDWVFFHLWLRSNTSDGFHYHSPNSNTTTWVSTSKTAKKCPTKATTNHSISYAQ
jgi:hypothetical protein